MAFLSSFLARLSPLIFLLICATLSVPYVRKCYISAVLPCFDPGQSKVERSPAGMETRGTPQNPVRAGENRVIVAQNFPVVPGGKLLGAKHSEEETGSTKLFETIASQPEEHANLIGGLPFFRETDAKSRIGSTQLLIEGAALKNTAMNTRYPYSIYWGSYRPARVGRAICTYEEKGLSLYWAKVDLGEKGSWFRLFTGYFPNKEMAAGYIKANNIEDA